jgi:hypothetical protein
LKDHIRRELRSERIVKMSPLRGFGGIECMVFSTKTSPLWGLDHLSTFSAILRSGEKNPSAKIRVIREIRVLFLLGVASPGLKTLA